MGFLDKVKGFVNETFLKEVTCSCCGAKGKVITFVELKDGNLLCGKCERRFPSEFGVNLYDTTLEKYQEIMEYKKYSDEVLKPMFHPDLHIGTFYVDTKKRLFQVIGDLIYELDNVECCNLTYVAEEMTGLAFAGEVTGKIMLYLEMKNLSVSYNESIADNVLTMGRVPFGKSTFVYKEPFELTYFLEKFNKVYQMN